MSLSDLLGISPSMKDELDEVVRREFGTAMITPEGSTNPYEKTYIKLILEQFIGNPSYHKIYLLYVGLRALDIALWHFEKIKSAQHVREVHIIASILLADNSDIMPEEVLDTVKDINTQYRYLSSYITISGRIGRWVGGITKGLSVYIK